MPEFSFSPSPWIIIGVAAIALAGSWALLRTGKADARDDGRSDARREQVELVMPHSAPPPATPQRGAARPAAPPPLTATPEAGDPYLGTSFLAIEAGYDPHTLFDEIAEEFGVPASLLKAVAYTESRMVHGSGAANEQGARGLMGLRETDAIDTLNEAAGLLQLTPAELVRDPVQNARGAAAVLKKYHDEAQGIDGLDGDAWSLALSRYSGLPADDAVTYAQTVMNILHEGMEHTLDDGTTIGIDAGGLVATQ